MTPFSSAIQKIRSSPTRLKIFVLVWSTLPILYDPTSLLDPPKSAEVLTVLLACGIALAALYTAMIEMPRWSVEGRRALNLFASVAMCVGLFLGHLPDWNKYGIQPDSGSYVWSIPPSFDRPPVLPLVIFLANGAQRLDPTLPGTPPNEILTDPKLAAPAVVRAVRLTKVAVFISLLFLFLEMSAWIEAPLVFLLFCGLWIGGFLFSEQWNYLLSEPIATAFVYLLVASFLAYLRTDRTILLPVAGFLCALTMLTRLAGVFTFVILLVMSVVALFRQRSHARWVIIGIAAGSIAFAPAPIIWMQRGIWTTNFVYAAPAIIHALQLAHPEDVELMPTETTRSFLSEALATKATQDAEFLKTVSPAQLHPWDFYGSNLYMVAYALVPKYVFGDNLARSRLFQEVSDPILRKYRKERFLNIYQAFRFATSQVTRIHVGGLPFWGIAGIMFALVLILRGRVALAAATLMLAHLAHVVVFCYGDVPINRYMFFAEVLFLLGAALTSHQAAVRGLSFSRRLVRRVAIVHL